MGVASLIPVHRLEQLPGVDATAPTNYVDEPEAILAARHTWRGADPAPFRGPAAEAIWFLCLLFLTDLLLVYFLVSAKPFDLWAIGAGFVVVAGVMRLGFSRLLG